ncbi:hypothetical protein V865_006391 [Kwoniella europaea PYCC6329]|uniref:BTB domain-containing protein n=1 Tax=Kwoniella europaea PYCC6329 TaxID=1423913 RepID=A0AAX4KRW6_9TREE
MSSNQFQDTYEDPSQRRWHQLQETLGNVSHQAYPQNFPPTFAAPPDPTLPAWNFRTDRFHRGMGSNSNSPFSEMVGNNFEGRDHLDTHPIRPNSNLRWANTEHRASSVPGSQPDLEGTAYLTHFATRSDPEGNMIDSFSFPDYRADLEGDAYLDHFAIQLETEDGDTMGDIEVKDTSSEYAPSSARHVDDETEEDLKATTEMSELNDPTKPNVLGLNENDRILLQTFSDTFFSLRSSKDPRMKDIGRGRWGGKKSILATYDQDRHHTDLKHFQTIIDGLYSGTLDKWPPIPEVKLKGLYELAINVPVDCNPSKITLVNQVESIVNKVCDTNIRNFIYPYMDYTKARGERTFTEEPSVFFPLCQRAYRRKRYCVLPTPSQEFIE